MAEGSAPSQENGVRHRQSDEHNDQRDGNGDSEDSEIQSGRRVSNDNASTTQTTGRDVPAFIGDDGESSRVLMGVEILLSTKTDQGPSSDEVEKDKIRSKDHPKLLSLSPNSSAGSHASGNPQPASSTTMRSPTSPQDGPRKPSSRTRGMSLRSSIFARSLNRKSRAEESNIEMQSIGISTPDEGQPQTLKKESQVEVTVSSVLSRFSSHLSYASPGPGLTRVASRRGFRHLTSARVKDIYQSARKFVLRIEEIQLSKDGRHIPVNCSRQKALTDERTGKPYVDNFIKSSKYTLVNFLPRQLFAQFSKLANFYFLVVAILQMIPGLSTTGTYTTIIPLCFFVSISMAKEGYEDLRRYRLDKAENNLEAKVLHAHTPVVTEGKLVDQRHGEAAQDQAPFHWASVKWQALRVGDIIKLERDQAVPADLVLLDSKGDNNLAYIETMALDGETDLKTKQPSATISGTCSTSEAIVALDNVEIVVEDPNLDLYKFEGKITVSGQDPAPLTNNEIIYRGSVLRNTPEAIGIVIYSGEECKIRMNATKKPRVKAPSLQATVNKIVIMIVIFVVALALFNTIGYQIWQKDTERKAWYLTDAKVPFGNVLVSFIIMFNTMIPLSLYVSLEIIKLAQVFLLNDVDMYDEASNTPFEARTSTINEELGQVSYIFSDKTGTLTENVMRFRKLSVAGTAWLHDIDLKKGSQEELVLHKKRKVKAKGKDPLHTLSATTTPNSVSNTHLGVEDGAQPRRSTTSWRSSAAANVGQPEHTTNEMIRYIQRRPHTAFSKKATMMILSLALCHTCLPERCIGDGGINYQAASPDELALVQAAKELGYIAFEREASILRLKTYPNGQKAEHVVETYEILDVIEFSSKRRRMSVVVRFPDNRICVICKGADSAIMERLRLATLASQKVAEVEKRASERRSTQANEALRRKSNGFPEARPSIALGRPSFARLAPIRDDIDGWLSEKEHDASTPVDTRHYSPRPSSQFARRSLAGSERGSRPLRSEVEDEPLVEEALVTNDSAVIERCFQHVHDFATEGFRTLLYGYRFLDGEEYCTWKKVYQDATTSIVDRQKRIEEAGELIEQKLELGGATAIEDKLQKGVPETVDRLRRANIKMWMLTGDKRETAINIGHSCRLVKDYSSVTILDHEAGGVEQSIAAAILDINRDGVAHAVVVIDGRTLGMLQAEESLNTMFLDLAILADSVVCCRASPSQKAALVHSIRRRVARSVTLAIGDGANDIAMLQEAHVGIGITGKEGLQAGRVSDYSIAQFHFLAKLLLVHGRWNYIRTAKYVVATFWKELLFYLTQALYQRWNGYTGTSLYEQWSLSQFNTLFTSLPVIFLGIFEKDLAASTLIAVPELYTKGQRSGAFNFKVYLSWMFMAASEAMIVFFTMKGLFGQAIFTPGKDLFSMGDMTFTTCIIVINIKLQLLEQRNRTRMALGCVIIEIGGWFLWNICLSLAYRNNNEYDVKAGFLDRFGQNGLWWLCLTLIIASCILFEMAVRALKTAFFPTDVETFQTFEKDILLRRRFEEAAASELQAGWHHGTARSSLELLREAEAQAKREGEVQDLLDRPRAMEEARSAPSAGAVATDKNMGDVDENSPIRCSSNTREMLSQRVCSSSISRRGA